MPETLGTYILKYTDCIHFVCNSLHQFLVYELWHTFTHLISRSHDSPMCSQHALGAAGNLCVKQWVFTALLPKKLSDSMAFCPDSKGRI